MIKNSMTNETATRYTDKLSITISITVGTLFLHFLDPDGAQFLHLPHNQYQLKLKFKIFSK